jgi:hypothetical protein
MKKQEGVHNVLGYTPEQEKAIRRIIRLGYSKNYAIDTVLYHSNS